MSLDPVGRSTMTKFKGIVTQEFIDRRQKRVVKDTRTDVNPYFQWDSEFVEYHQCQVDPQQKMYEGYEYDTTHSEFGNLDYKMYSKTGVHVSQYIQKQIRKGLIDHLVIWKWTNGYKQLYKGDEVEYNILGTVPANFILDKLNEENRFDYDKYSS